MDLDLIIRMCAFVGIFAVMVLGETSVPRCPSQTAKAKRRVTNLAWVGFNMLF